MRKFMLPVLKQIGGKRWLAPKLERLVEEVSPRSVLEAFAGGLAFSLHFEFEKVIANDLNSPLIGFYKNVLGGLEFDHTKFSVCPDFYGETREKFNQLLLNKDYDSPLTSQYYYYFNKQAHSGLWRLNKEGRFNVWLGKGYNKVIPQTNFKEFAEVAHKWDFRNDSFEQLCFNTADLNLIDPPYYKNFVNYSSDGFSFEQQIHLLDKIESSTKPTIYCNSFEPRIIKECKRRGFSTYMTVVVQ